MNYRDGLMPHSESPTISQNKNCKISSTGDKPHRK